MRRLAILCRRPALAIAGCGDGSSSGDGRTVVATTTQVADLVREVGGGRVSVDGMLRPGGDPHDYEPRPSDVAAVARADLVFRSGGEVDEWLDDVIDNAGGDAEVVSLIDSVERLGDDPHWWQDPRNAVRAVERIRARADESSTPAAARVYRRNAERVERELRPLDARDRRLRRARAAREAQDRDDARRARLLRAPLRRSRWSGAVIPSLSTQAQASAGDVQRLVEQIRRERVEAIFPESSVNPDIERAIAREAGARDRRLALRGLARTARAARGRPTRARWPRDARALVRGMSGGRVDCGL